jgi:hypothetical protein
MNGSGIASVATPPSNDIACSQKSAFPIYINLESRANTGPTPKARNIGFAANGNPAAKTLLRNVFAEVADAAYTV